MARRHPLLKGLGILCLAFVLFFFAVFFYAYFTGGEGGVLTFLGGEGVGVLELEGAIDDARDAVQELKRFGASDGIKAIVVRIETPGGSVAPTQEIYEEIEKLKKKKPVFASLGGMATSGGYYIASACHQIVANPGTLTGSIGVIMELGNVEELMRKVGIQSYSIKSGAHKDIGSPLRPLSAGGKEILQSVVDSVHDQFVRAVAKGRSLPENKVREVADGRVYSGEQAKSLGLVDVLGNMEDAIDLVAKRAGIKGEPQVVLARRAPEFWWQKFLFGFVEEAMKKGTVRGLRYEWYPYSIKP
jgi:protease-4